MTSAEYIAKDFVPSHYNPISVVFDETKGMFTVVFSSKRKADLFISDELEASDFLALSMKPSDGGCITLWVQI